MPQYVQTRVVHAPSEVDPHAVRVARDFYRFTYVSIYEAAEDIQLFRDDKGWWPSSPEELERYVDEIDELVTKYEYAR